MRESRVDQRGEVTTFTHTHVLSDWHRHTYTATVAAACTSYIIVNDSLTNFVPLLSETHIRLQPPANTRMYTDTNKQSPISTVARFLLPNAPTLVIDNHNGQHVVFPHHHGEPAALSYSCTLHCN